MTYNVHGCLGMDGEISPSRIADVIATYDPDVVALQELDRERVRSGRLDQTRAIAEIAAMECHFHPALRVADEEYGDAILSKYPLKVVKADALPEPQWKWVDEPRGALWVSLRVDGHEVQVINTHFGLGRIERRMQARELLSENWVGSAGEQGKPVIVCGDFNSPSSGMVHRLFRSRLRDCQLEAPGWQARRTFPTRFPVLCLDYIFVSEKIGVVRVDVPRTPLTRVASDHLPIIAELDLSLCKATLEGAVPELTSQRLLEQGESRAD